MAPMRFVGVDGCKGGWFSAGMDQNGYDFGIFRGFAELLSHYKDAELILVDIPIGLPEGNCGRKCDSEAWRKLGYPRQLSVVPTPTRLTAYVAAEPPPNIQLARDIEHQISGKGLSPLAFAMAPKIAEVDGIVSSNADSPNRISRGTTPKYSTCQRYRASNFREGTQPLSFCDGTQDCGSRYGIVEL